VQHGWVTFRQRVNHLSFATEKQDFVLLDKLQVLSRWHHSQIGTNPRPLSAIASLLWYLVDWWLNNLSFPIQPALACLYLASVLHIKDINITPIIESYSQQHILVELDALDSVSHCQLATLARLPQLYIHNRHRQSLPPRNLICSEALVELLEVLGIVLLEVSVGVESGRLDQDDVVGVPDDLGIEAQGREHLAGF
jgi:hypothetical protein